MVEDVDGIHARIPCNSAVVIEVIDGHEVVMLTVDGDVLQGDGLRSVGPTNSIVSG